MCTQREIGKRWKVEGAEDGEQTTEDGRQPPCAKLSAPFNFYLIPYSTNQQITASWGPFGMTNIRLTGRQTYSLCVHALIMMERIEFCQVKLGL